MMDSMFIRASSALYTQNCSQYINKTIGNKEGSLRHNVAQGDSIWSAETPLMLGETQGALAKRLLHFPCKSKKIGVLFCGLSFILAVVLTLCLLNVTQPSVLHHLRSSLTRLDVKSVEQQPLESSELVKQILSSVAGTRMRMPTEKLGMMPMAEPASNTRDALSSLVFEKKQCQLEVAARDGQPVEHSGAQRHVAGISLKKFIYIVNYVNLNRTQNGTRLDPHNTVIPLEHKVDDNLRSIGVSSKSAEVPLQHMASLGYSGPPLVITIYAGTGLAISPMPWLHQLLELLLREAAHMPLLVIVLPNEPVAALPSEVSARGENIFLSGEEEKDVLRGETAKFTPQDLLAFHRVELPETLQNCFGLQLSETIVLNLGHPRDLWKDATRGVVNKLPPRSFSQGEVTPVNTGHERDAHQVTASKPLNSRNINAGGPTNALNDSKREALDGVHERPKWNLLGWLRRRFLPSHPLGHEATEHKPLDDPSVVVQRRRLAPGDPWQDLDRRLRVAEYASSSWHSPLDTNRYYSTGGRRRPSNPNYVELDGVPSRRRSSSGTYYGRVPDLGEWGPVQFFGSRPMRQPYSGWDPRWLHAVETDDSQAESQMTRGSPDRRLAPVSLQDVYERPTTYTRGSLVPSSHSSASKMNSRPGLSTNAQSIVNQLRNQAYQTRSYTLATLPEVKKSPSTTTTTRPPSTRPLLNINKRKRSSEMNVVQPVTRRAIKRINSTTTQLRENIYIVIENLKNRLNRRHQNRDSLLAARRRSSLLGLRQNVLQLS